MQRSAIRKTMLMRAIHGGDFFPRGPKSIAPFKTAGIRHVASLTKACLKTSARPIQGLGGSEKGHGAQARHF